MGVSSLIAFTGIGLAIFLWLKNRHIPDADGAAVRRACTSCC